MMAPHYIHKIFSSRGSAGLPLPLPWR